MTDHSKVVRPSPDAPALDASPGGAAVDEADLLDRCQHNSGLVRRVVARFVGEAPGQLADLRRLLAEGDGARLARALHALRGSLGVLGARMAHDLAHELEQTAVAGALDGAGPLLAALEREVTRACRELETIAR